MMLVLVVLALNAIAWSPGLERHLSAKREGAWERSPSPQSYAFRNDAGYLTTVCHELAWRHAPLMNEWKAFQADMVNATIAVDEFGNLTPECTGKNLRDAYAWLLRASMRYR